MSAAKESSKSEAPQDYRITGGPWSNAWMIAAVVGVVGLALSAVGGMADPHRFAYSYLFAFAVCFTVCAGAMFFVLVQRLTSASWSVTIRRTAEFFMGGMPMLILLFVPVLFVMGQLFPWLHAPEHATTQESASAASEVPAIEAATAHEAVSPADAEAAAIEHEDHARILEGKRVFLNAGSFGFRLALYAIVWLLTVFTQLRWSFAQDKSKDPQLTVKAQRWAPLCTIGCALTVTFAGFDWIMSLYPFWYSTIFGVWFFAGGFCTIHAILTLMGLGLRSSGLTRGAINTEHFHDLGKLTFGFLVFWAYISFAQFFLIWYASIPEETVFYHFRWGDGPWRMVSLALILCHFVLPFLMLLSRNVKRSAGGIAAGCVVIIVMHIVEMYWAVLPNYVPHAGMEPGDVLQLHWMDLTCLLGVGGIYLATVFRLMRSNQLIPVGDPRLSRSLAFENA